MPPADCERRLKRRLANAATSGLACSIVSRRGKATGLSIINSLASYGPRLALQGKGILARDTHEHTIRIAPPLVITSDQVDWALEQFAAILTQDLS